MAIVFTGNVGKVGVSVSNVSAAPSTSILTTKEDGGFWSRVMSNDENRSMRSLLEDGTWGFTTSITGGFTDQVSVAYGQNIEEATGDGLTGNITVSGIAFGRPAGSCDGVGARNGVEAAFYYYQQHSITKSDESVGVTIGKTTFKTWCTGIEYGLQDANSDLWYWRIKYTVSSFFNTTPLDGGQSVYATKIKPKFDAFWDLFRLTDQPGPGLVEQVGQGAEDAASWVAETVADLGSSAVAGAVTTATAPLWGLPTLFRTLQEND